jgi:hypothetical protein
MLMSLLDPTGKQLEGMDSKHRAEDPPDVEGNTQPSAKRQPREDAEAHEEPGPAGSTAGAPDFTGEAETPAPVEVTGGSGAGLVDIAATEEATVVISIDGKRSAQPSGDAQGNQPPAKRQSRTRAAEAHSSATEDSRWILPPLTISFSMRFDARVYSGEALEAALRRVVAEIGGQDFRMGRTRVGPSDDTLQRVLPFVLSHVEPAEMMRCVEVCRPWQQELVARGFCRKTMRLCSTLAQGGTLNESLWQNALMQRLSANTGVCPSQARAPGSGTWLGGFGQNEQERLSANKDQEERIVCLDANAFLQRSWGRKGTLHTLLQAASQEPGASFLSRGAASMAQILGLPLIQWVGKPQGRYPGLCTLAGHSGEVFSVAYSPNGKRVVSCSYDKRVKIWDAETGTEVSFTCDCVLCGVVMGIGGGGVQVSRWQWSEERVLWQVRTLEGHLHGVFSVAFSPDGQRIVSGANDRRVKIWDAETGAEVSSLEGVCWGWVAM